ncbi:PREDICTED: uncharacterized protein LOC104801086 [Tarenaya hassleriana]|uniref:uncharacterized protein LOC104801086 n=1 Tax=Tarenaya hassleriana TaxID=28532 RepID=UPI00053CA73C|nr:PREDICTED: uncharacterized protein LOC104801086 [Tarenaya hassleriana]
MFGLIRSSVIRTQRGKPWPLLTPCRHVSSMASSATLLGPPAVAGGLRPVEPEFKSLESSGSSLPGLISPTAALSLDGNPPMGLTENLSPTFLSSGNPCLDFFFHIVPDTPPDELIRRMSLSWAHDPLTTLKLVCNLRGVRGTGKSDREGFYTAAFWMFQNHPKTLALNLQALVEFGYLKDLPEILYRIMEGQQEERGMNRSWRKKIQRKFKRERERKSKLSGETEERILENAEEICDPNDKEKARALRKQREFDKAKRALERYNSDASYRLLFDSVSDLFAEMLKSDLKYLSSNELNKVSLASKWCPSIDSSYDKSTLICEAIARRIFPREKEYDEGVEEAHYAYRVRDRLRKQVLVPLRRVLELPEVFMSANEWNSLKYNRVASVAMTNYKELFEKHDKERFAEYLENVRSGKEKMAAGALLPHQIVNQLVEGGTGEEVAELQWARMVDDLSKKGKLKNCMAVCDVSGSMSGTPMEVCVALGLLVSELSEEPWKGKVITFSENPQLYVVEGETLKEKTAFIREMEWGMNTDFQRVFDRILEVAVESNLTDDQMIKRLFVFSDMEFDDATGKVRVERESGLTYLEMEEMAKRRAEERWETDYEVVRRKYGEKGFEKVPEMVFWNLRSSSATPVVAKQKGVAMVSGFSKNLLTMFLEEGGIVNPEQVMVLAINGKEYQKLVIHD